MRGDDFQCFITHGHQFEPLLVRNIAGWFGWSPFIRTRSDVLKSGMDIFWNYFLHGRRNISGLTYDDIDTLLEELDDYNIPQDLLKKLRKYLRKNLDWEKKRKKLKNKRYYNEISRYFKRRKFHWNNDKITHIIFGHSHKPEKIFQGRINKCIHLINSGGWQKILKPSFVEINLEEKKKININLKRYKLSKELKLLKFILSCFNYLFGELIMILLKNNPEEYEKILSLSVDKIINEALDNNIISNNQFNILGKYRKLEALPQQKTKHTIKSVIGPQIEDIETIKNIFDDLNRNI